MTSEGSLHLAVLIDLHSRMLGGWATKASISAALVTTVLALAVARRRPKPGLIIHTNQKVQYASDVYRQALSLLQACQSTGTTGDCRDNAVTESSFHSFKTKLVHGSYIETRRDMEYEVFEHIYYFHNNNRKHSPIGLRSPMQFEAK